MSVRTRRHDTTNNDDAIVYPFFSFLSSLLLFGRSEKLFDWYHPLCAIEYNSSCVSRRIAHTHSHSLAHETLIECMPLFLDDISLFSSYCVPFFIRVRAFYSICATPCMSIEYGAPNIICVEGKFLFSSPLTIHTLTHIRTERLFPSVNICKL